MVRNSFHLVSVWPGRIGKVAQPTREINGAVVVGIDLVDHILKLRLRGVLAEGAHDGAELLGGDLAYNVDVSSMLSESSKYCGRCRIRQSKYRFSICRAKKGIDVGGEGYRGVLTITVLVLCKTVSVYTPRHAKAQACDVTTKVRD